MVCLRGGGGLGASTIELASSSSIDSLGRREGEGREEGKRGREEGEREEWRRGGEEVRGVEGGIVGQREIII